MSSYYYVRDAESETGFTPMPEDEYLQVIFRVAKKNGVNITDEMIIKEFNRKNERKKVK